MQIEVPVAYFYICVVYLNYMYYVKAAEEMLSMWYFGTLYAVIYSLNLDLANKYVPLKITLLWSVGAIFYKKTIDKSIVFLYLEFMILF